MHTVIEVYATLLWHPVLALLPLVTTLLGVQLICVFEQKFESPWVHGFLTFVVIIASLPLVYAGLTGIITALGGGVFAGPLAMLAALFTIVQVGSGAIVASFFYNTISRHREWEMLHRQIAEGRSLIID